MKLIDGRTMEWDNYRLQALRGETSVTQKRMLIQNEESPGDFDFSIVRILTRYYVPRHHHNWCQIRYTLEGSQNYAPDKDIPEGAVAYFPEGTFYGPQNVEGPMTQMLLQFGGPSRQGYMSHEDVTKATAELNKGGSFIKGNYETKNPDGSTHREDGYEATWRHVFGRPLAYPTPQYSEPILMFPEAFPWDPVKGKPGNFMKQLGAFSGDRVRISMVRTDAGARYVQGGNGRRELLFVIEGEMADGASSLGAQSVVYTKEQESVAHTATRPMHGLLMTLPSFEA